MRENKTIKKMVLREEEGRTVEAEETYYLGRGDGDDAKLLREYEVEEVLTHCTREDCWIIIHEHVYNVTRFVDRHPGGWLPISQLTGKPDATDAFEAFHPARVHKNLLPTYMIGRLKKQSVSSSKSTSLEDSRTTKEKKKKLEEIEIACREVRNELLREGAFSTSWFDYVVVGTRLTALFFAALYLTLTVNDASLTNPRLLLGACAMGIFWQQLAFVGHDVGHNGVAHVRSSDLFYGIVFGNTLMGISLGWWKQSHNVHHIACNSVEHDPDIQHLPVFAVSERIFLPPGKSFFSTYHKKLFNLDPAARLLVANQHLLFYPVMALARLNLYLQSWLNLLLLPHGKSDYRLLELLCLALFFTWNAALLFRLPDPRHQAPAWLLLSHAVAGILHVQITISHFPMDVHEEGDAGRYAGWFAVQMQTTMDVETWPWFDWFHGGLQFQVEHHMFPRLPRHKLRLAKERLTRKLARVLGRPHEAFAHPPPRLRDRPVGDIYASAGFFRANLLLLQSMKVAAEEARGIASGSGVNWTAKLKGSALIAASNLEG